METSLHGAARALEDAFFAKENARLLEQLRAKAQHEERRKALREVIRIPDEQLVDHLLELGLGPETVLAVTMVPLAMVAWADGAVQPKEREAILRAAAEKGIVPDSIAGQVLNSWLTEPLGAELVSAWRRYIQTIWPSLTPHERAEVRQMGVERARMVAEAAGGFLGLGNRISAQEKAVIDDIATLLAG
jgi:tellurite resistance protein